MKKVKKLLVCLLCISFVFVCLGATTYAEEQKVREAQVSDFLIKGSTATVYIYWLDNTKSAIPNETTYFNLFNNWDGITTYSDSFIDGIPSSPNLTENAVLVKGDASPAVYVLTNGTKHWIENPDAFNSYNFNWDKILVCPQSVMDQFPTGSSIY